MGIQETETFTNSIDLATVNESMNESMLFINEFDKDVVMQIWTVPGHVYHVACQRVVWNGTL